MSDWTAADFALAARNWDDEPAGPDMDRAVLRLNVDRGDALLADAVATLSPSCDVIAALALVEASGQAGQRVTLLHAPDEPVERRWRCEIRAADWWADGFGDTLALAICRAHLCFREDD